MTGRFEFLFYLISLWINVIHCLEIKGFKTASDCEAHDGIHKNNTVWNPVVGNFQVPCLACSCLNGVVDCQKTECPKLTCKRKRKEKGKCCEVCRKRKKNKKDKKSSQTNGVRCKNTKSKTRKRKHKKGRKRGRQRKVNRGGYCLKEDNKDMFVTVNPTLPVLFSKENVTQSCIFKKLCLPRKTRYLVYRHFEENFKAFFAFDDLKSATVEVWLWTVSRNEDSKSDFKNSVSDFQELIYPANWFRQQISDGKIIFGAARNKKLKTFKRRLKRTYDRCINSDKRKRCTTKILMQEILCADFEEIYRKCD